MGKSISSNFESGSIEYINEQGADINLRLEDQKDGKRNHWFNFKITKEFEKANINIEKAHLTGFWRGWEDYKPFISEDGKTFKRSEAAFLYDYKEENEKPMGTLKLNLENITKDLQIAWYEPYSQKRYNEFVEKVELNNSGVNVVDYEKNMKVIEYITSQDAETYLFVGRQHPGETMSSFFMEGMINKFLGNIEKLKNKNIIIAPFMNIEGAIKGSQRLDENGVDYNRAWNRDDIKNINIIKDYILNYNVSIFGDIHGDEVDKEDFMYINPDAMDEKNEGIYQEIVSSIENLKVKKMITKKQAIINATKKGNVYKPNGQTAVRYVEEKNDNPFAFIYEISAHSTDPDIATNRGEELIESLIKITEENEELLS